MDEIAQRIIELIQQKGLTNASFADAINIKRPIVSHILSGRNKPSLHVVLQILNTFEDIDATWLLLGTQKANDCEPKQTTSKIEPDHHKPASVPQVLETELPTTMLLVEGNEFRIIKKR